MRFNPWPPSVDQGSSVAVSCGVGHRHSSNPAWLWLWPWLWRRLAATAPIRPLALEPPHAAGAALEKTKKKKKKKRNIRTKNKIRPFAATWMKLETLILSEIRKKGKDKYHMISLISGI